MFFSSQCSQYTTGARNEYVNPAKVCHRGEDTIAVSMESTKQINVKLIAFITL